MLRFVWYLQYFGLVGDFKNCRTQKYAKMLLPIIRWPKTAQPEISKMSFFRIFGSVGILALMRRLFSATSVWMSASWPSCGDFFPQLLSGTALHNSASQHFWQWCFALHLYSMSFATLFCDFFLQFWFILLAILLPNICGSFQRFLLQLPLVAN